MSSDQIAGFVPVWFRADPFGGGPDEDVLMGLMLDPCATNGECEQLAAALSGVRPVPVYPDADLDLADE